MKRGCACSCPYGLEQLLNNQPKTLVQSRSLSQCNTELLCCVSITYHKTQHAKHADSAKMHAILPSVGNDMLSVLNLQP